MASETTLKDTTVTWANSDPVNTEKTIDIDPAVDPGASRDVVVIVRNPSLETALTVEVQQPWVDAGTTRYAKLTSFTAAVTATNAGGEAFVIADALATGSFRLSLKNATAVGGSGAFSAAVQVWRP